MPRKQKLIVNADDYGLCDGFNRGIVDLMKEGLVTSTTVMILRDCVDAESLLELGDKISIGLHLEIGKNAKAGDIEKQMDLFKDKFGRMPSHLDGHQHCHILPGNLDRMIGVARKYNLPVRAKTPEDRKKIKGAGVRTTDRMIAWVPQRKENLFRFLNEAKGAIVELVCHPGYEDKNCDYPYNAKREIELNILKGENFKKSISRFELISYNQIA